MTEVTISDAEWQVMQIIWRLLNPDDIGVQLTEGCMMDPEASVSALVFHHPDCRYFATGDVTPAQD
jgi:cobalamin-dependent methionine synthase I